MQGLEDLAMLAQRGIICHTGQDWITVLSLLKSPCKSYAWGRASLQECNGLAVDYRALVCPVPPAREVGAAGVALQDLSQLSLAGVMPIVGAGAGPGDGAPKAELDLDVTHKVAGAPGTPRLFLHFHRLHLNLHYGNEAFSGQVLPANRPSIKGGVGSQPGSGTEGQERRCSSGLRHPARGSCDTARVRQGRVAGSLSEGRSLGGENSCLGSREGGWQSQGSKSVTSSRV